MIGLINNLQPYKCQFAEILRKPTTSLAIRSKDYEQMHSDLYFHTRNSSIDLISAISIRPTIPKHIPLFVTYNHERGQNSCSISWIAIDRQARFGNQMVPGIYVKVPNAALNQSAEPDAGVVVT